MAQPDAPRSANNELVFLLLLGSLIAGAALGRLLLPPGRLGIGAEIGMPGPRIQTVAAAARPSPSARYEAEWSSGHEAGRDRQSLEAPSPDSPEPRPEHPRRKNARQVRTSALPSRALGEDWRLEMQVGLTWQYAAGTHSRALHAPVSPPIGEPG